MLNRVTIILEWERRPYAAVHATVGDTLVFKYTALHNVYELRCDKVTEIEALFSVGDCGAIQHCVVCH